MQCAAIIMKKWCTWNRIRWVCHTLCGEQLTLHSELQGGQVSGTLRSSSQNFTKYLSEPFQVEFGYLLIAIDPKLQNMFVNCTRRAQNNKQKKQEYNLGMAGLDSFFSDFFTLFYV